MWGASDRRREVYLVWCDKRLASPMKQSKTLKEVVSESRKYQCLVLAGDYRQYEAFLDRFGYHFRDYVYILNHYSIRGWSEYTQVLLTGTWWERDYDLFCEIKHRFINVIEVKV